MHDSLKGFTYINPVLFDCVASKAEIPIVAKRLITKHPSTAKRYHRHRNVQS
jgi:hypothetical protein